MIGVASDVAGVAAFHLADGVRKAVPDGFPFSIFVPGSFNLIGRGRRSENKFLGKLERGELHLWLEQFAGKSSAGRQDVERCRRTERAGQEITTIQMVPPAHGFLLDKKFQET